MSSLTLTCRFCQRKLGTWNYKTVTHNELSEDVSEPVTTKLGQTEPLNLSTKQSRPQTKKSLFVFGLDAKIDGSDSGCEDNTESEECINNETETNYANLEDQSCTEKPAKRQKVCLMFVFMLIINQDSQNLSCLIIQLRVYCDHKICPQKKCQFVSVFSEYL